MRSWAVSLFSRVTSGRPVISEIEGLRFIAIASVILFHLNGYVQARTPFAFSQNPTQSWVHGLLRHGRYGVQLFFPISLASAAWLTMPLAANSERWVYHLLPLLILVAYVGAFRGVAWPRFLRTRWLVLFGGMCYPIYLYHYLLISLVGGATIAIGQRTSYDAPFGFQALLLSPILLLCCALVFSVLERPFVHKDPFQRLMGLMRQRTDELTQKVLILRLQ